MPNRERAERAVRRRVAVAADDRHARLRDAELRADHVDDALAAAARRVQRDAELLAVAAQRLELLLGELVGAGRRSSARCGPSSRASGRAGARGGRPGAAPRTPAPTSPRGSGAGRRRAAPARPAARPRRAAPRSSRTASGPPRPLYPVKRAQAQWPQLIELRRIPDLPPYAFAEIDALKLQAAARRGRRHRPRLRQPGHPVARDRRREAGRGGGEAAQPPLLGEPRDPEPARGDLRAVRAALRRRARPRSRGDHDDRREGGARAPALGARRAGRRGARAGAELPDPHVRARVRRGDGRAGGDGHGGGRAREPRRCLRALAAAPARRDRVVPAQPDDHGRRRRRSCRRSSTSRASARLVVVHDFAYADIAFDGHEPPSILAAEGARSVAVELYTLTKGFSMAGWRVGFCRRQRGRSSPGSGGSSRTSTTARSSRSRSPRR